jgi:hypothetical protein
LAPPNFTQEHVAEFWIGRIDSDRVHELLDVMVHYLPRSVVSCGREASHLHQTSARANVQVAWEYCAWVAIAGLATAQRRKASARGVLQHPRHLSGARLSEQAVLSACRACAGSGRD